jgi:replicative DNA helicase
VFWDKIVEITSIGEQDVYAVTVAGTQNVVVQGISVLAA